MTTTVPRVDLLVRQLDMAWALFEHYLKDLNDQARIWEPSADRWTVHPDAEGRWVADWQAPEPDPVRRCHRARHRLRPRLRTPYVSPSRTPPA